MQKKKKSALRRMISHQEFSERYHTLGSYFRYYYPKDAVRFKKKLMIVSSNGGTLYLKFYENDFHPQHGRISGCEIFSPEDSRIYKIVQFTNLETLFDLSLTVREIMKRIKDWERNTIMYEDLGYQLLTAVHNALSNSDAKPLLWLSFAECTKNHDCLQRTDERWKREFSHRGTFRIAMNKEFTIHLVFTLNARAIIVSLEGLEAQKLDTYRQTIQTAVDQTIQNKEA